MKNVPSSKRNHNILDNVYEVEVKEQVKNLGVGDTKIGNLVNDIEYLYETDLKKIKKDIKDKLINLLKKRPKTTKIHLDNTFEEAEKQIDKIVTEKKINHGDQLLLTTFLKTILFCASIKHQYKIKEFQIKDILNSYCLLILPSMREILNKVSIEFKYGKFTIKVDKKKKSFNCSVYFCLTKSLKNMIENEIREEENFEQNNLYNWLIPEEDVAEETIHHENQNEIFSENINNSKKNVLATIEEDDELDCK
ncbi:hypothetical protein Mgra_00008093 [Meloidogyne graminicola]|uniref:Uncharacterized protein n=1 Tax=Meloidogyne graminicola TaxID=189291 RepID=A0A8S9ZGP2_9BILA|nr:hypothetical protein Mgra_00008093 [Meloidogyne graminicola]KAF7632494.1 hypothetical protein Mgra_00008093 [Meloidogyne graminicola]